jgi:acyl-CoA thioester hydrolase
LTWIETEKFYSEELVNEYSKTYEIRWSDLDANGHVNYSAYINAAGELRYHFFWEHGFPPEKFEQLGSGPVYTAIHAEFLREVRLGETVTITYVVSGLSPQGGRWRVQHDVLKSNGKKAVSLEVEGVILHLTTRKPILPPPELLEMFQLIPRARDFEVLSETNRRNRATVQIKQD